MVLRDAKRVGVAGWQEWLEVLLDVVLDPKLLAQGTGPATQSHTTPPALSHAALGSLFPGLTYNPCIGTATTNCRTANTSPALSVARAGVSRMLPVACDSFACPRICTLPWRFHCSNCGNRRSICRTVFSRHSPCTTLWQPRHPSEPWAPQPAEEVAAVSS